MTFATALEEFTCVGPVFIIYIYFLLVCLLLMTNHHNAMNHSILYVIH